MEYAYPCSIVPDHDEKSATGIDAWVVSFPDVYGANTGADTRDEAIALAEDCLVMALGAYMRMKEDLPVPSPLAEGQVLIRLPVRVVAKLALYMAMKEEGITQTQLGARLGIPQPEVHRMLDLQYKSHVGKLEEALRALGRGLAVSTVTLS